MPRLARIVFPQIPHHITQRGNRRGDVFFSDSDRGEYLQWLKEYCDKNKVDILSYCLMTNHVHLVAVPSKEDGLERVLRPLHTRYAQKINREHGWKGHLWQGRYFSSPLDGIYMWAAIRYVDRNPVRAKVVKIAENYKWSSAAGHCELRGDGILTTNSKWVEILEEIDNWSEWLAEGDEPEKMELIRRNIAKGLPCGSDRFIRRLEKIADRILHYRPLGRPRRIK
jgi:putative transposase